jgi:hypothetical protein
VDLDSDVDLDAATQDAIEAGLTAVGAGDVPVIVATDFASEIRTLAGGHVYSADRIAGTVAGKTIQVINGDTVIVLNAEVVPDLPPSRVERLAAHEACHALIDERGESLTWNETAAIESVGWHRVLVYMTANAVEEYRVESAVMGAGYPVADEALPVYVADALMNANMASLEAVLAYRDSDDVLVLRDRALGLMDRYTKQLAHLVAAQPRAPFSPSALDEVAQSDWGAVVAPVWDDVNAFYGDIPDATQAWDTADLHSSLASGWEVTAALMRTFGFEYRGEDTNESFWSVRSDEELAAASHRYVAGCALRGLRA